MQPTPCSPGFPGHLTCTDDRSLRSPRSDGDASETTREGEPYVLQSLWWAKALSGKRFAPQKEQRLMLPVRFRPRFFLNKSMALDRLLARYWNVSGV